MLNSHHMLPKSRIKMMARMKRRKGSTLTSESVIKEC